MKKQIGPVWVEDAPDTLNLRMDPVRWAIAIAVIIALGFLSSYHAFHFWADRVAPSGIAEYILKFFFPVGGPLLVAYGVFMLFRGNKPTVFDRRTQTWSRGGKLVPANGALVCRAFQQGHLYAVTVEDGEGKRVAGAFMFQRPEPAAELHRIISQCLITQEQNISTAAIE